MSTWRIWAYALSLAVLWLGLRFAFGHYFAYNYAEAQPKGVLLNLVFLLSLILITLYTTYSKEPQVRSYFDDFKLCLKSGIAYSVAITVAIAIYYTSSNDLSIKRTADYNSIIEALDTPEKVAAIKSANKDYENFTKEEIQQKRIESTNFGTSVKNAMLLSLASLVFCALIYSLIFIGKQ